MKTTFRTKIICLAVLSAGLPMLIALGLLVKLEVDLVRQASEGLERLAKGYAGQLTRSVYGLCSMGEHQMNEQLDQVEITVSHLLQMKGELAESETVTWHVKPDEPHSPSGSFELPRLSIGTHPLLPHARLDEHQPLVDTVKSMTGMDCSLFQRINEAGDMLRVASTLEHPDRPGYRAVGTIFPATLPDGTPNPTIIDLVAGTSHRGIDHVLGHVYVTGRLPLTNETGRVIASIGVGKQLDAVDFVRDILRTMDVGEHNYIWVAQAEGPHKGRMIVSERGLLDGENLWDARDAEGRYYVRDIIRQATTSPPGTLHQQRLDIRHLPEEDYRARQTSYTWFEPWQWVIGTSSFEDEFQALNERILKETRESMNHTGLITLAAVLLVSALAFAFSKRILHPLKHIILQAEAIARGNLVEARTLTRRKEMAPPDAAAPPRDEIDALNRAFLAMTESLASLLGQVQRSGVQVTTSTTQIAATSRQLESTSVEQAASTRAISKTTAGITQTTQQLARAMDDVSRTVDQTGEVAERGRARLDDMKAAMRHLLQATEAFSAKLSVINQKTSRISNVVTTINAISDQTNLLSLNAAIEAEKAGEHGRGFMVVAREITRLADQAATATKDIDYVVREMESSVSSGVMEMDRFAEGVRGHAGEVEQISGQLGAVIDQVHTLAPLFESVQTGMNQQADGARQINNTMEELAQAADQSRDSLHEFQHVTEQLHEAVLGLQQEVSRFKV